MEGKGEKGERDLAGGTGNEEELAAAGAGGLEVKADLVRCPGRGKPELLSADQKHSCSNHRGNLTVEMKLHRIHLGSCQTWANQKGEPSGGKEDMNVAKVILRRAAEESADEVGIGDEGRARGIRWGGNGMGIG